MYFITLNTLDDLDVIIHEPLHFDGHTSEVEDLLYQNMWCITLAESAVQQIAEKDMVFFLNNLLHERSRQIKFQYPMMEATFYTWFDSQARQLRFDILPGHVIDLPFKCAVRIATLQTIVHNFITTTGNVMCSGNIMEIITPENDTWENNADEKEDFFVLDVYVAILNKHK
jgi:hypothetical protein